jgi:hypothetical protein
VRFYLRYCKGTSPQQEEFRSLDAAVARGQSLAANDNIWGVEISDDVSRQVVFGSMHAQPERR